MNFKLFLVLRTLALSSVSLAAGRRDVLELKKGKLADTLVEGKNKILDKLDAYIDKKFAPKPEKSGIFSSITDKKEAALQAIVNQLKGCDKGEYLNNLKCVKCRTCAEGETILKECDGTTTKDVVKCQPQCITPLDCPNLGDVCQEATCLPCSSINISQPCKISSNSLNNNGRETSSYALGACQQINQSRSSLAEPVYGCVAGGALGFKGVVVGGSGTSPSAE